MMSPVRLLIAFLLALCVSVGSPARAGDIAGPDQEAIRGIISSQIEAFQRDDGATAYDFASPMIRNLYPTIDQFMGMVRNGYPQVYRPKSLTFGPIADTEFGPRQKVFITGPDGRSWVAVYSFEKQPDGSWKINGVQIIEDDGATI